MRWRIRSEQLTVVVTLFILLCCNFVFWQRMISYTQPDSFAGWLFIGVGFVFLFLVLNTILTLLALPYVFKPVISVILIVSPFIVYFMSQFGVMINAGMIQNAVETNPAETRDLLTLKMLVYAVILGLLPLIALWRTQIEFRSARREAVIKGAIVGASLVFLGLIAAGFYKDFASLFRNHRELRFVLVPSNYIQASLSYVRQSRSLTPIVVQPIAEDAKLGAAWATRNRPSLTVLVVGETARAANFSLNGYERDTNPELKKIPSLINFPDFHSCGTDTAVSVPCMFSMFERAEYSDDKAKRNQGLLDVMQRAGLSVTWWDNQSGCKGACDRVPNQVLSQTPDAALCRDGECWDEMLLKNLPAQIDSISKEKKNAVLVLHMMGSHGPAYYKRYPPQFEKFKPACNTNQMDKCSQGEIMNSYDNTLLYTDYVLANLIKILEANETKLDTAMMYVSDHGESIGERGLYLHGSPYVIAPSYQTHIPAVMWFSPQYLQSMKLNSACLQQRATQSASHDNVFHSMLGLLDIETKTYKSELDLFAGCKVKQ
ncbi:phosphoethanolamine--lipid A transferase [Chitinibacter bivalviorum]|uniref:Phosphoethanolamine--lipid A transferase n=1 Tax=Chitinibacter bivalviorum TaxID=2739434 RepID=A0A7H9BN41_9NEIS|nr:phosphoethanolamine--lipid A transferase [Chitinibacter bivalviorum]QLG89628.1 phosphoethanolamine--lipid A transferase [Chitinibacter bivalviorum]